MGIVKRKMKNTQAKDKLKVAIEVDRISVTPQQYHRLITSLPLHTDAAPFPGALTKY